MNQPMSEAARFWLRGEITAEMRETIITQTELRRLRELRTLGGELRELRATIRRKVEARAPLESGGLDLQITEAVQRSFSYGKIVELLGEEKANQLKEQLEPTLKLFMDVVDVHPRDEGRIEVAGDVIQPE